MAPRSISEFYIIWSCSSRIWPLAPLGISAQKYKCSWIVWKSPWCKRHTRNFVCRERTISVGQWSQSFFRTSSCDFQWISFGLEHEICWIFSQNWMNALVVSFLLKKGLFWSVSNGKNGVCVCVCVCVRACVCVRVRVRARERKRMRGRRENERITRRRPWAVVFFPP